MKITFEVNQEMLGILSGMTATGLWGDSIAETVRRLVEEGLRKAEREKRELAAKVAHPTAS